jgi:hypothetical protein
MTQWVLHMAFRQMVFGFERQAGSAHDCFPGLSRLLEAVVDIADEVGRLGDVLVDSMELEEGTA